jgi:carbon starvation protein CstA
MTNRQNQLTESSPSVQAHLGILQSVIQRMATNSNNAKTASITIVSAILVIVADKGQPDYAWIALIPNILFMALDTYYLALEKGFRETYNNFVCKLHRGEATFSDLYFVSPSGHQSKHQREALRSFSIWGFYVTLLLLIIIARSVVIGSS